MSLPKSEEIAKVFAIARDLADKKLPVPCWSTPKMNGVRAMWVPGVGLFSKDGIAYETGVLPHIESALAETKLWLDGELYSHGMSLQFINARAGVIRKTAHADHASVQFHIFDSPMLAGAFDDRQNKILELVPDNVALCFTHFISCSCQDKANAHHDAFVSQGFEGTVYKSPGHYRMGPSDMMLKRKAWTDEDYEVVELVEGEGKYTSTLGAVVLRSKNGAETFRVGSFEFTDDERFAAWAGPKPALCKVRFMTLTERGVPHVGRVLALY